MSRLGSPHLRLALSCLTATLAALLVVMATTAALADGRHSADTPDLKPVFASKPPASLIEDTRLAVSVELKNTGDADARVTKLALFLATGKHHTKRDVPLGRFMVNALPDHSSKLVKLTVHIPGVRPGTYRLIACADATRKVPERNERNDCRAGRPFALTASAVASAPVPRPSPPPTAAPSSSQPAFTLTDDIDGTRVLDASRTAVSDATPIVATLRAGNGIAGGAGYTRAPAAPEGFLTGATETLAFPTTDDDQVTLPLPFAFPFGGIAETSMSVSTNGWVSFGGSPAIDFWGPKETSDYRGPSFLVGQLQRGIMPYWSDQELTASEGESVRLVRSGPETVAIQWTVAPQGVVGPLRTFQLVLRADGSFQMDYPGANAPGSHLAFVGYSLGTGPQSVDVVASDTQQVPQTSIAFTPNPVPATASTPAGTMSVTVPRLAEITSMDSDCSVSREPEFYEPPGLVSCVAPALLPGQQVERHVTYRVGKTIYPTNPANPGTPEDFRETGTYLAGSIGLADEDEIDPISFAELAPSTDTGSVEKEGAEPPEVGKVVVFKANLTVKGQLDEPYVRLVYPDGVSHNQVIYEFKPRPCVETSPDEAVCKLPSGTGGMTFQVGYTPEASAAGEYATLEAEVTALNAPPSTLLGTSPAEKIKP